MAHSSRPHDEPRTVLFSGISMLQLLWFHRAYELSRVRRCRSWILADQKVPPPSVLLSGWTSTSFLPSLTSFLPTRPIARIRSCQRDGLTDGASASGGRHRGLHTLPYTCNHHRRASLLYEALVSDTCKGRRLADAGGTGESVPPNIRASD